MTSYEMTVITAMVLLIIFIGMRLLYGCWAWERRKQWSYTKREIDWLHRLLDHHGIRRTWEEPAQTAYDFRPVNSEIVSDVIVVDSPEQKT